ncbi:MAG TPA: hypothetical protein VHQ90_06155 [Thermoanaerobaculia bacterium]|nr:hypothetical protein [Thermoanaerobaculia bacterium]
MTAALAGADRALLARVLEQSRVARTPRPPAASYTRDLAAWVMRRLTDWMGGRQWPSLPRWVVITFAVVVVAVVLGLLARTLWSWLAARRRAAAADPGSAGPAPADGAGLAAAAAAARAWDAAAWRAELDRLLAEERIAEALEAAWWWLARAVAGAGAAPTWTGRDLVRWARRDDLREPVAQLDVFAYGPRRPPAAALRQLVGRLEALVA